MKAHTVMRNIQTIRESVSFIMSTNFYMVPKSTLQQPDRYESPAQVHIGKRHGIGGGLTSFSFQGYNGTEFATETWPDGTIWCVTGGIDVLHAYACHVVDEYGTEFSVAEFVDEITSVAPEHRGSQYEGVKTHNPDFISSYWLDHQGYCFTLADFC